MIGEIGQPDAEFGTRVQCWVDREASRSEDQQDEGMLHTCYSGRGLFRSCTNTPSTNWKADRFRPLDTWHGENLDNFNSRTSIHILSVLYTNGSAHICDGLGIGQTYSISPD